MAEDIKNEAVENEVVEGITNREINARVYEDMRAQIGRIFGQPNISVEQVKLVLSTVMSSPMRTLSNIAEEENFELEGMSANLNIGTFEYHGIKGKQGQLGALEDILDADGNNVRKIKFRLSPSKKVEREALMYSGWGSHEETTDTVDSIKEYVTKNQEKDEEKIQAIEARYKKAIAKFVESVGTEKVPTTEEEKVANELTKNLVKLIEIKSGKETVAEAPKKARKAKAEKVEETKEVKETKKADDIANDIANEVAADIDGVSFDEE